MGLKMTDSMSPGHVLAESGEREGPVKRNVLRIQEAVKGIPRRNITIPGRGGNRLSELRLCLGKEGGV